MTIGLNRPRFGERLQCKGEHMISTNAGKNICVGTNINKYLQLYLQN